MARINDEDLKVILRERLTNSPKESSELTHAILETIFDLRELQENEIIVSVDGFTALEIATHLAGGCSGKVRIGDLSSINQGLSDMYFIHVVTKISRDKLFYYNLNLVY